MREGVHELPDGRVLRWASWGPPDGRPVLFHHGTPSSRLHRLDPDALELHGVHFVGVDRPGVGGSTPQPGRRVVDWPDDAHALLDGLGLERVIAMGHSMGGAYALACAARLPQRVDGVALLASIAPWHEPGFRELASPYVDAILTTFERDPEGAPARYREEIDALCRATLESPDEVVDRFAERAVSEVDRDLLGTSPAIRRHVRENMVAHFAQGGEGLFEERMAGHVQDWGFEVAEVSAPVHVFQGLEDTLSPPRVGRALSRALPDATLHTLPGTGHFTTPDLDAEVLRIVLAAIDRGDVPG